MKLIDELAEIHLRRQQVQGDGRWKLKMFGPIVAQAPDGSERRF